VRSALEVFSAELRHHASGRCTAVPGRPFLPLPPEAPPDKATWSDRDWS
jgi:hypothetical protein